MSSRSEHVGSLGQPAAPLVAWTLIVVLNAGSIAFAPRTTNSFATALLHHFYDAGQLIAIALAAVLLVWAWTRLERRMGLTHWHAYGFLLMLGWSVSALTFDDVHGFIHRQLPSPDAAYWYPLLTLSGGIGLAVAAALGRLLDRPYWRWLVVVGCSGVVLLNQMVLVYEYAGPHLIAVLCCATVLATSHSGPASRIMARVEGRPARLAGGLALLACVAAAAVFTTPPPTIALRMFQMPGAVLAPFLVALDSDRFVDEVPPLDERYGAWLRPTADRASVEPGAAVLPRDELIVVLLTVDALRADLIGDRRYVRTLPTLEAMRRHAVHFTRARSVSPLTWLTISSLFTGLYPAQFDRKPARKGARRPLYNDTPYLALPDTSIRTVHAFTNANLNRHATGFKETIQTERQVGRKVLEVLQGHQRGPLFVYAHFMEPHAPYGGEQHAALPEFERYLQDVALVDAQLRDIREYVQKSDKRGRTILIVSADHGEAFGEHGFRYHAKTLYDEMIRVPMLIEAQGVAARVVSTPVSSIDIAPTVRDLFGLPTPGRLMGQSLTGFLRGEEPVLERPIALQSGLGHHGIVFPDGYKAIFDARRKLGELYDLTRDPQERSNLLEDPSTSKHLGTLIRFFGAHRSPEAGDGLDDAVGD